MGRRGPRKRLDQYEMNRLCQLLIEGKKPKQVAWLFGIDQNTVTRYARRCGLSLVWAYNGPNAAGKVSARPFIATGSAGTSIPQVPGSCAA